MLNARELFDIAIRLGEKNDPRGEKEISRLLKEEEKKYKKLKKDKKEFYDKEKLKHVYSDSRFLAGNPKSNVKKVLVGIDMEVQELLLASELNRNGTKIDAGVIKRPALETMQFFVKGITNKFPVWTRHKF